MCVCVGKGGGRTKSDLVVHLCILCGNNHGGNQFNSSRVASKEVRIRITANVNGYKNG